MVRFCGTTAGRHNTVDTQLRKYSVRFRNSSRGWSGSFRVSAIENGPSYASMNYAVKRRMQCDTMNRSTVGCVGCRFCWLASREILWQKMQTNLFRQNIRPKF